MTLGDRLTLTIEKPAAGGRMIARHEGAVVLVSGAIPGERVEVQIEKIQRGTAWARCVSVVDASPDRVDATADWACGGNVLAHVAYPRQTVLKREIIEDAFARIGRMALPSAIDVAPSPPEGYRMRARLHVVAGRIGFFREGTHQWCDPASSRQLLESSLESIVALQRALADVRLSTVHEVELSENCAGDQRAFHLLLEDDGDPARLAAIKAIEGVRGISCGAMSGGRPLTLWGTPVVEDQMAIPARSGNFSLTLERQAHAFFQANRFLLAPLVAAVVDEIPDGRVLDLYAGVGLFAVALAARGVREVIAIEGDRVSARDLKHNASRYGDRVEARHQSVEAFLGARRVPPVETVIVDPPRTGMSRDAVRSVIALRAPRVVYVSCDVATLARDARMLVDAGYTVSRVRAFDLFPNTAHVETLAVFVRADSP